MMKLLRYVQLLLLAIACCCSGVVHAQDKATLETRLQEADQDTALDDPAVAPWHLKLEVQLFDSKGKPTEQGTIEEFWAGPATNLVVYDTPSYSAKILRNADGAFHAKDVGSAPSMLRLMLEQVVHPLPSSKEVDRSTPELRKENFGKVSLECIMLSQPMTAVPNQTARLPPPVPTGLYPTYCFDPGKNTLRATTNIGSQTILRNAMGTFQNHSVATAVAVRQGGVTVASAHVATLSGMKVDPEQFIRTPDMTAQPGKARIAGGILAGTIVGKVPPVYPESARSNHIYGAVVLRGLIGVDGHVNSLQLMSTPDVDLALAAMEAVRQWTYKPYLLNGQPTEVDTTITVNFSLSR